MVSLKAATKTSNSKSTTNSYTIGESSIEKVNKTWCKRMSRSRGGLRKKDYDTLSTYGTLQDVEGDGNCGVYAAVEGLLNCLIAVTTDVEKFRKEVHDFIDGHRKEVLTNFTSVFAS